MRLLKQVHEGLQVVTAFSRLGNYISTEKGFRRASLVGFGVPAAVIGSWVFRDYGQAACLLVVPGAALAAYLWGVVMWKVMFRDIYARKRAAETSALTERRTSSSD